MITHPRLAHALMALRPGSKPIVDFVVQQDAGGEPFLVEGSMQNPPTQEEVDALTEEQLDLAQKTKNGFPVISDVQFVAALEQQGFVTHEEAIAFVKIGSVPSSMQALIDAVPDETARKRYELWIAGSTQFHRDFPAVNLLKAAPFSLTDAQIDAFWIGASAL